MTQYTIGELARQTNTNVATIRFYETSDLMPAPARTAGGQRRYTQDHLDRLKLIRHARELGFPVDDVRELLRLAFMKDAPCHAVDALTAKHLKEVESKLKRLRTLRRELKRMLDACANGPLDRCQIIEVLSAYPLGPDAN